MNKLPQWAKDRSFAPNLCEYCGKLIAPKPSHTKYKYAARVCCDRKPCVSQMRKESADRAKKKRWGLKVGDDPALPSFARRPGFMMSTCRRCGGPIIPLPKQRLDHYEGKKYCDLPECKSERARRGAMARTDRKPIELDPEDWQEHVPGWGRFMMMPIVSDRRTGYDEPVADRTTRRKR